MFKNKLYTILKPYVEIVPLKMYALGEGKGVGTEGMVWGGDQTVGY